MSGDSDTRQDARDSIGPAGTTHTSPEHQKHASVVAFAQQSPISAPAINDQNFPTQFQAVTVRKRKKQQNYLRSSQSSKSFGLSKTAAETLNYQLS